METTTNVKTTDGGIVVVGSGAGAGAGVGVGGGGGEKDVELDGEHRGSETTKKLKEEVFRLRIGLGVFIFVSVFLLVFLIAYASTHKGSGSSDDDNNNNGLSGTGSGLTGNENNNQNNNKNATHYCLTKECFALAESILSSLDTSVDPCEDFFQYACGGFQEIYEYELTTTSRVNAFAVLDKYERRLFLDGLYYPEADTLETNPAVAQARQFFDSCLNSSDHAEEVELSQLLEELTDMVDFDGANSWDAATIKKFHKALAWLGGRSWNFLFELTAAGEDLFYLGQNYGFWKYYSSWYWGYLLNSTVAPLYQSLFDLTEAESYALVNQVKDLSDTIYAITKYNTLYTSSSAVLSYLEGTNNTNLFGSSSIMNYTNVMFEQFNTKHVEWGYCLEPDINYDYFPQLNSIVENTSPEVIQYFLFANVLIYGLDYKDYLQQVADQPRISSRSEYCVSKTKVGFPYVYGYILYESAYSKKTYEQALAMVEFVVNDGVKVLINSNTFMDAESRSATDDKINKLRTYVGFPPPVYDYDALAEYYSSIVLTDSYMDNLESALDWSATSQQLLYNGELVNMTGNWPSIFSDSSSFRYWLTGINAFYVASSNFFAIPVTITQAPFFSVSYPSSLNFGGLGAVIGHEMSHGFDPKGVLYDGDGERVDSSIWTTETKEEYDNRVQCIIDQYSQFSIDGAYVKGDKTKTENVADNSGSAASWLAWQKWRKNVTDPVLPLNMTSEQLFFMGWARSWCQITKPGYYKDWDDVHAPNPARVWGVMQNSQHFAQAFGCAAGSPMNPTDKCELWA